MGKKGKRTGKAGGKPKVGPGKARRERAAAFRDIDARIDALIERMEEETQDLDVFSPLEEREDCPICFLQLPQNINQTQYYSCCGKTVCIGCSFMFNTKPHQVGQKACPFCRSTSTTKESMEALQRRIESDGDISAMATMVCIYMDQGCIDDAVKLCVRAAESGNLNSIAMLGLMFFQNEGEEWQGDAMRLSMIAAKLGSPIAHFALGKSYMKKGSVAIGVKHLAYAAEGGHEESMEELRMVQKSKPEVMSNEELEQVETIFDDVIKKEYSDQREEGRKNAIEHGLGGFGRSKRSVHNQ